MVLEGLKMFLLFSYRLCKKNGIQGRGHSKMVFYLLFSREKSFKSVRKLENTTLDSLLLLLYPEPHFST